MKQKTNSEFQRINQLIAKRKSEGAEGRGQCRYKYVSMLIYNSLFASWPFQSFILLVACSVCDR